MWLAVFHKLIQSTVSFYALFPVKVFVNVQWSSMHDFVLLMYILYILQSWLLMKKHLYEKRCIRGQIVAKASLYPEAGETELCDT